MKPSDTRASVTGAPGATVTWEEVVARAGEPIAADHDFAPGGATYPFGAHVAVVEVDTETGGVRPLRHVAVDDCGRIVNPLIVAGQQMGGVAQGVSQALWESFEWDEAGNPVTSTFADYLLPTALDVPRMELGHALTTSPLNPLGIKGAGEAGAIPVGALFAQAIEDALGLPGKGIELLEIPLSPHRLWHLAGGAR